MVISCAANEHHQIGGKMVADIFEMYGWDAYFPGADTPVDQMVSFRVQSHFVADTQVALEGHSLLENC